MALDIRELEDGVREFWAENNIVEKVRESTEGNEKFFMIDGPPYLTGPPHMGQFQNKTTKDTMMRFKQMQGFHVWDQAGFDTHGLPNEVKTEEELGIENKNEIGQSISVAEFIEKCKERAVSAQDEWRDVMWQLAVWQDFEDPYLTYDPEYIESVWHFISHANNREMLYSARRPIYWCPRCQTTLAGYEVTDEYREVTDDAIYVKFPLRDRDESLLIWTTTPWTIPGNMAIIVHPDFDYARVEVDDETLIMAEKLVPEVMGKAGYDEEEWEIIGTFKGSAMQGKSYHHVLADEEVPEQSDLDEAYHNVHTVIANEDLVTLEEGTGVVHAASGHGPEDYEVVKQYDIPVFSPVDKEGVYTEQAGKYQGDGVYEANKEIVDDLEENGALFYAHKVNHEFPHCWRCKSRIIYRATRQWFLDISPIKDTMIEENQDVTWCPESAGSKRFHNWLVGAHDWCISRQNYWGIPLPVWECQDCDNRVVLGSFEELEGKVGELSDDFDPHKHVVDRLNWECEECGDIMERVVDNIDVWMDSGCAPFASLHYPFEEEPFESLHPMDFIVEGSDQIRGWFYSLMFCGVTMFDESPYEQVCLEAFVLDEQGQKMSKSIGNVIDPQDVMDELGADVPRFWIMENSAQWENAKVDMDEMKTETRRLLNVYWNTAQFLHSYSAHVDIEQPKMSELQPEDKWVLSRLNTFLEGADEQYDSCNFHEFCREFEDFILEDLSRWYVKLVRHRVKDEDMTALWTLHHVLKQATLAVAPIIPHMTEKIYIQMFGEKESVHMDRFPEADTGQVDEELEEDMAVVRELVETINSLRQEENISLRWPLQNIVLSVPDDVQASVERLEHIVKDRANIKEVEFGEVETRVVVKPNYASLGPRFGSDAEKVADYIEEMDHDQVDQLFETGTINLDGHEVHEDDVTFEKKAVGNVSGKNFQGGELFLDTTMTTELEQEAFVRELIRNIQDARKDAGLEVTDHVDLHIKGDVGIVQQWKDDLLDQVNVRNFETGTADGPHQGSVEFRDYHAEFGFSKVEN